MKTSSPSLTRVTTQTLGRLARKLPVVFLAALACYGLYYFDLVKSRFDDAKSRQIIVGDDFVKRVGESVVEKSGGNEAWPDLERRFRQIYRPFNSGSEIMVALTDQVITERDEEIKQALDPEVTLLKQCVADKVQAEKKRNLRPQPETTSEEDDFEPCSKRYREKKATKTNAVIAKSDSQAGAIYSFLTPEGLKQISDEQAQAALISSAKTSNMSPFEASLQPTLDDKSGLNIIYQIFRITCAIVIVFSLVAVVGLMLRALWAADGLNTLIDKAKGLVGEGGSATPGIARAAVISVAALGLGTAVATGVAMGGRDRTGRGEIFDQSDEGRNVRLANRLIHKLAGEGAGGTDVEGFGGNGPGQLSPNVYLYPQFLTMPRINLPTLNVVPDPVLSAQVKTYLDGQKTLNETLAKRLELLSKPATDISVANQKKAGQIEPEPLRVDLKGLMPEASLSKKFEDLNKNLEPINTLNLKLEDLYRPQNPRGRNFFSRLFASDHYRYFVSPRSVEQLKRLLPIDEKDHKDNKPILDALVALSSKGGPMDEKELLTQLTAAAPTPWTDGTRKNFELWKATILAYTRVP